MASRERRPPLLVTGVPRSGTTWLARKLSTDPRTSMPGREPMNPRGRQFALGGALHSWVRREAFPPAEAAVIRRCFAGREPRTLSRYGVRQWAALLPTTRMVIKDPFAMLSIGAIHRLTGALPVLIYRHPAAVLASYRRMGWSADTADMLALGAPAPSGGGDGGDLQEMAAMWTWCHQVALSDLALIDDAVVVSHQRLTAADTRAWLTLGRHLGVELPLTEARPLEARSDAHEPRTNVLHDFERSTADVESGWRRQVDADEIRAMENLVGDVWEALENVQFPLPTSDVGMKDEST